MPPRFDRPEIFAPLSPDDQTPGYLPDGEALTADHPILDGEPPDPTQLRVVRIIHRVGGPVRKRIIGVPDAGTTPTQQRKGRLLIEENDLNDRRTRTYDPNQHQANHAPELTYGQARSLLGETDDESADRRSFATAIHDKHTLPWTKTSPRATREQRINVLAQGGFRSPVLKEKYRRDAEALDAISKGTEPPKKETEENPFDDITF